MSRNSRVVIPGQPLHITQRGVNRAIMFMNAEDHILCTSLLQESSVRSKCAIHAYVLMSNHLHLLVTPEKENSAARLMQSIGLRYVRYFNHRYQRTGTLWEGRYRSSVIQSQRYFFACSRYIELNPVRAAITNHPASYVWSSYHTNANGAPDSIVTQHELYRALAIKNDDRHLAYRALFDQHLDNEVNDVIRKATKIGTVLRDTVA